MIRITDGKRATYTYRNELKELGLTFKSTGSGTGYWYTMDDSRQRELLRFCNKRKLRIDQEDSRYTRSSNYRDEFFKANKGYKHNGKKYHCAYCGKILTKKQLQVDHVIAVDAVKKHLIPRLIIKLSGIKNVNDPKNLVASCPSCNNRKSNKQGLWVLRGYIGRHIWFWRIYYTIIAILILLSVLFVCQELKINGII